MQIEWKRLLNEFAEFNLEDEDHDLEPEAFAASTIHPDSEVIELFVAAKRKTMLTRDDAIKTLYFFLLHKRYTERLNLLYFIFDVFDEGSRLPDEVVNRTPFPHEDGIPKYKHFLENNFQLKPEWLNNP